MMLCFRCPPNTKDTIDRLIATGNYRTPSDVICVAVNNLALLEEKSPEAIHGDSAQVFSVCTTHQARTDLSAERRIPANSSKISFAIDVPPLFSCEGIPTHKPPKGAGELPPDIWASRNVVPLDRWVLGQFNKLLPAKVNCRALLHLLIENDGKPLEIDAAAEGIAKHVVLLGDFLTAFDQLHDISRDDSFSTAFPTTGEHSMKARTRYANQFVAYLNGKGEVSGLMLDLKLIDVVRVRDKTRIVPTKCAWQFALLKNPVLDGEGIGTTEKFSTEERRYLQDHILTSVPVESFAYHLTLMQFRRAKIHQKCWMQFCANLLAQIELQS